MRLEALRGGRTLEIESPLLHGREREDCSEGGERIHRVSGGGREVVAEVKVKWAGGEVDDEESSFPSMCELAPGACRYNTFPWSLDIVRPVQRLQRLHIRQICKPFHCRFR